MWQFLTLRPGQILPLEISSKLSLGEVKHDLTHRRYQFTGWLCETRSRAELAGGRWVRLSQLQSFPLSRPQLHFAKRLETALANGI